MTVQVMFSSAPFGVGLILIFVYMSCGSHPVEAVFYRTDDQRFSWSERRVIQSIADETVVDVRRLLPALPDSLTLRVRLGREVLEATGENARHNSSNVVSWTVDPTRLEGVSGIARTRLRPSLFHHFYALVRTATFAPGRDLLEDSIAFGLATVFTRDFSGGPVPWAAYAPEAETWVDEVLALPDGVPRNDWMSRHPDGRRRIGPSVGVVLVDRALARSRLSVADLVGTPAEAIVAMALAESY